MQARPLLVNNLASDLLGIRGWGREERVMPK